MDLFKSRLNCTSTFWHFHGHLQLFSIPYPDIKKYHFSLSNASDFYGPLYNIFHVDQKFRNIFSLFSPFTLNGWIILAAHYFLVGFMLRVLNRKFNPLFWLLTILLEQNDDLNGKLGKASMFVVLCLIYT